MRGMLILVALFVLASTSVTAAGVAFFTSPSRNIVCGYLSAADPPTRLATLMCVTRNDDFALAIYSDGARRKTEWDDAAPVGPVLRYGRSRKLGPFRCSSSRAGMTCVLRWNGRGFFISRDTWSWVP